MKRRELKTRRVCVVLPATRRAMPNGILPQLKEALRQGRGEAKKFVGGKSINDRTFTDILESFQELANGHEGLLHLMRALFFTGLHLKIRALLKKKAIPGQVALDNLFLSAASSNIEMCWAQLHLVEEEVERLFFLPDKIANLPPTWWSTHVAGSLAVSRLARFLISEGMEVFFPTPKEDIAWKIDLIARSKGDSCSMCFQVKSDSNLEWVKHRVLHTPPNGESSDATHRFFEGVRRFQERHHGIYMPIELSFGSRQFDLGSLTAKGHVIDALRHVINDARTDPHEHSRFE